MGHIFVSYSRKDEAYTIKLIEALEKEGFDIWYDREMLTGDEWIRVINQKIDECDAFVLIVTDNSKDSKWVRREALYAMQEQKKIFPLLLQGKLWMLLQDVNYFNVIDGSLPNKKFFNHIGQVVPRNEAWEAAEKANHEFTEKIAREEKERRESAEKEKYEKQELESAEKIAREEKIRREKQERELQEISKREFAARIAREQAARNKSEPQVQKQKETPPVSVKRTMLSTYLVVGIVFFMVVWAINYFKDNADFTDEKGSKMNLVPAGTFKMGSTINDDEKPIHDVYLDGFYMDIYEVTNAAYKLCVSDGKCELPDNTNKYNNLFYARHPVVYVNWNMAKTFCEWRGSRLPTEAEWEKAARGTDARTYPWGADISCDKANYYGCKNDTVPVGSYESGKSPYGMYDMAGNVWEWVNDWHDEKYYQSSPSSNPLGPNSGQYRVLRGGSWIYYDNYVRSAGRYGSLPTNSYSNFGFRCVRSLP